MFDPGVSYYYRDSIIYYLAIMGAEVAALVLWAIADVKEVCTTELKLHINLLPYSKPELDGNCMLPLFLVLQS